MSKDRISGNYDEYTTLRYWEWSWNTPYSEALSPRQEAPSLLHKLDKLQWCFVVPGYQENASRESPYEVLDLGCGAGKLSDFAAISECHVTGVDINPVFVYLCNMHLSKKRKMESNFVTADCRHVDTVFGTKKFDIVVSHMLLNVLPDLEYKQTIQAVYNVLKPGGYFAYLIPNPAWKIDPLSKLYEEHFRREDTTPWGATTVYYHRPTAYQIAQMNGIGFRAEEIENRWAALPPDHHGLDRERINPRLLIKATKGSSTPLRSK